jgi:hypothetical protein
MKGAISVFILLISLTVLSWGSALGDLAGSMSAGEWAELTTNNIVPTLSANGASGMVFGYAEDIKWDPVSGQLFYMGGDHADAAHFISFTEATNTWQRLPRTAWLYNGGGSAQHGYDHSAIDVERRYFVHRPFGSTHLYKYDIDNKTWSSLPDLNPWEYLSCCYGLEYYPERSGYFVANGQGASAYFLPDGANQWTTVSADLAATGYQTFAEYNPVHKVMLFGGGSSKIIYTLDNSGSITRMNDAPISLTVNSTIHTVDPVSGDYLIFAGNGVHYSYDVADDQWQQLHTNPPIYGTPDWNGTVFGIVATSLINYGVNLFVKCYRYGTNATVFLYKHTGGNTPVQTGTINAQTSIRVSPNPFSGKTSIRLPGSFAGSVQAAVFGVNGRLINRLTPAAKMTFDASHLPAGIYILKIKDKNRVISRKLFVHR